MRSRPELQGKFHNTAKDFGSAHLKKNMKTIIMTWLITTYLIKILTPFLVLKTQQMELKIGKKYFKGLY